VVDGVEARSSSCLEHEVRGNVENLILGLWRMLDHEVEGLKFVRRAITNSACIHSEEEVILGNVDVGEISDEHGARRFAVLGTAFEELLEHGVGVDKGGHCVR